MRRMTTWGLIVGLAMFSVGCGDGTSQSTPEAAYNGFKNSISENDWSTAFKYFTDDSQNMFLGGIVFGGVMTVGFSQDEEKSKAFEELLKKHGIDFDKTKEPPQSDPEAAMIALVENVKDKGACFQEVMKFVDDMSEDKEGKISMSDRFQKSVLKETVIEGDKATLTFTVDGKDEAKPMILVKKDGKWYLDMLASQKAGRA